MEVDGEARRTYVRYAERHCEDRFGSTTYAHSRRLEIGLRKCDILGHEFPGNYVLENYGAEADPGYGKLRTLCCNPVDTGACVGISKHIDCRAFFRSLRDGDSYCVSPRCIRRCDHRWIAREWCGELDACGYRLVSLRLNCQVSRLYLGYGILFRRPWRIRMMRTPFSRRS